MEENVGVHEPQCADRSSNALFRECESVKSTSSTILMESNRLEGSNGSTGDNSIFLPRLIRMTLPDFQPRLHAAGMATLPCASRLFKTTSTNLSNSTRLKKKGKFKSFTKTVETTRNLVSILRGLGCLF